MHLEQQVNKWTNRRFYFDAGYWAGSNPDPCYLDSPRLEMFYLGIKTDIGVHAATNFVRFVNKLQNLAPQMFIAAFERFANCGYTNVGEPQRTNDRIQFSSDDRKHAQGQAVVMLSLGVSHRASESWIRNVSSDIKEAFIAAHLAEIPKGERQTDIV